MKNCQRIDVHQHVVPPFWANELTKHGGDPSGWKSPKWSPQSALDFMDSQQIQTGVLSLTAPGVTGWKDKSAVDMARRVNEYTADLVHQYPTRFGNFVTLPLPDIEAALQELDYAFKNLQADGVVLLTNYNGIYLGDKSYNPLWEALDALSAVVFIHPAKPPMDMIPGLPGPLVDYPMDTTRTALHMVTNGVMRRYRKMKVILSHAGGFIPYASYRFAQLLPGINPQFTTEAVLQDLKSFYFDTALSGSDVALKSLLAFAPQGHVLFGSDYPYAPASVGAAFTHYLDNYPDFKEGEYEQINQLTGKTLFPRLS
ncbi:TPA: amidohydrolase family protein [Klebsiella oxytoca]